MVKASGRSTAQLEAVDEAPTRHIRTFQYRLWNQFLWIYCFILYKIILNNCKSHQTRQKRHPDNRGETLQRIPRTKPSTMAARWKIKQEANNPRLSAEGWLRGATQAEKATVAQEQPPKHTKKSPEKGRKWLSNKTLLTLSASSPWSVLEMSFLWHWLVVLVDQVWSYLYRYGVGSRIPTQNWGSIASWQEEEKRRATSTTAVNNRLVAPLLFWAFKSQPS